MEIYKITYPNGKIYIGQDRTDDINYFGSAKTYLIAKDFNKKSRKDITIRKQIIWKDDTVSITELTRKEFELIRKHKSNDPKIGYNLRPKIK